MQMQFTVVTVAVLLCCCCLPLEAVREAFYQVHEDYDVASFYHEINVSSLIKCAVYCNLSTECEAATFDASLKQCQLSNDAVLLQNHDMNKRTIVLINQETAVSLNSSAYKILNNGNYRFWHFDRSYTEMSSPVTVFYQSNDDYVLFSFEKMNDGSYKIKNPASGIYIRDGDGFCPCDCLNGMAPLDEEYKRFQIHTDKTSPDRYRIVSMVTGRYVRADEDYNVSSKKNQKDDYSLFTFIPV